jgi:hypothetical protein
MVGNSIYNTSACQNKRCNMDRETELLALKKQSISLQTDIQIDPKIDKLLQYKVVVQRMIELFNDRIINGKLTPKFVKLTQDTIKCKQISLEAINVMLNLKHSIN